MIAKIGDTVTIDHTFRRPTGDAPTITGTPQYTIRKGASEIVVPTNLTAVSGTRYTATWNTTGQSAGEYVVIATLTADGLACEEIIDRIDVVSELTNLDAAVSSRASQASLDTLDDYVDTEVAAIKAKTDNLPADPASETNVNANETKIDTLQTNLTAVKAKTDNLPSGVKKNTALSNFEFLMANGTDHVTPQTGLTITAERSIDGAAFAACANSVTEVANGIYKINLAAADLNGDVITLKFSAPTADTTYLTIKTNL